MTAGIDLRFGDRVGFRCVHAAELPIAIGALLDEVTAHPASAPPRTGHLGSWDDILTCRSGATDFNEAICRPGYGYPSIYAFTQTETLPDAGGDPVYRPGSVVRGGRRTVLPVWTWDGAAFAARSRDQPYFCPLVLTESAGERLPLVSLHRRGLARHLGTARFEADVVAQRWDSGSGPILRALLDLATEGDQRHLAHLVSHAVTLDGRVRRARLRMSGKAFLLGEHRFATAGELVDSARLPFLAVAQPERVLAELSSLPPVLPVLSHHLMNAWWHLVDPPPAGQPWDYSMHWGARAMAGFPPRRPGYLAQRSVRRALDRLCVALARVRPGRPPARLLLLPAAAFLLCSSTALPRDTELLSRLCAAVEAAAQSCGDDPAVIEATTAGWAQEAGPQLSDYFRARFAPQDGPVPVVEPGRTEEPAGFRRLTFQQASLAVGVLHEQFGSRARA